MSQQKSQTVLEFDGKQVPLDGEFDTSKFGIMDAVESIRNSEFWGKYSNWGNNMSFENISKRLQDGHPPTIAAFAVTVMLGTWVAYTVFTNLLPSSEDSNKSDKSNGDKNKKKLEDVAEPIVLRDFTPEQLREFDGENGKPIYVALQREVFDVSSADNFYGVGSGYHCFAGREASRAMAKMSFEESELSNMRIDDLGPFERSTLDDWYQKFKFYKNYPIVGKVSVPPSGLKITIEELSQHKGKKIAEEDKKKSEAVVEVNGIKYQGVTVGPYGDVVVPTGETRIDEPIYLGINGKVLDVSYGGVEMYGVDGPYAIFAGIDASRALAKMSFKPEDVNSRNIEDLSEAERKVLQDWEKKYIEVKKYPIIGEIV